MNYFNKLSKLIWIKVYLNDDHVDHAYWSMFGRERDGSAYHGTWKTNLDLTQDKYACSEDLMMMYKICKANSLQKREVNREGWLLIRITLAARWLYPTHDKHANYYNALQNAGMWEHDKHTHSPQNKESFTYPSVWMTENVKYNS